MYVIVGPSVHPNGFDITFQVKEKRLLTSSTGTQIGNNEGNMVSEWEMWQFPHSFLPSEMIY